MQFNKNTSHFLTLGLFIFAFLSPSLQAQQGLKKVNKDILTDGQPPVDALELLDFTGFYSKTMQQVTLSLETGDEKGYTSYLFERRETLEGNWDVLGFVVANGKSSYYDYIDRTPLPLNYYRVRAVDRTGRAKLLKIISVSKDDVSQLKVYPKIVKDSLLYLRGIEIADTTAKNKVVQTFVVFNMLGQRVLQGKTKAQMDISHLPRGIYLIKIGEDEEKFLRQ